MKIDIKRPDSGPNLRQQKLMEVYVHDFGDNYHRLDNEPSNELERRIRSLKRRYKKPWEFREAYADYCEYMDYLYELHGGKEVFKLKYKNGAITEFVPYKPKLKGTPLNKFILKNKIVVSRVDRNMIDEEKIDRIIEEQSSTYDKNDEANVVFGKPNIDKKVEDAILKRRIGGIMDYKKNTTMHMSDVDYLDEFFKLKNKKKDKHKKHKESNESVYPSLTDYITGDYLDMIDDTTDDDQVILYGGSYITQRALEDVDVYYKLNELGWNSYRLMRRAKGNKHIAKMFKKEEKRKKKKQKKHNNFLVEVMTDGGYDSYEEFEREMLDFTSKNMF